MRHALVALVSLFLLSACDSTASLKELRHAEPSADAYQAALASRYQEYAEQKVAAYDWWTSKYFADKGLMAAYGRDVLPEDPAAWNIPKTMQDEFAEARNQLMAALPAAKQSQPAEAATAVVAYDKWVELQDDAWDEPRIADARDDFFAALGALKPGDGTANATDAPVETTSTVLYFPFDAATLTDTAKAAIAELASYLKSAGNASININGHADRAGSDEYNMSLSEQRARLVEEALLDAGVPQSSLHYFAFGESDPEQPTDDGQREPLNRRVEIFIE